MRNVGYNLQQRLQSVFALASWKDCSESWDHSLSKFFERIFWFSTYESLVERDDPPSAIVIDTDFLPTPKIARIKTLRELFPQARLYIIHSQDEAEFTSECFDKGCRDVLTKPVGSNELSWMLRKANKTVSTPKQGTGVLAHLTQISNASTESLLQLATCECLQELFKAKTASWVSSDKIACSAPRNTHPKEIFAKMQNPSSEELDIRLPIGGGEEHLIFLAGVKEGLSSEAVAEAKIVLEYAHLSLLNLKKFSELKKQTYTDDLTGLYNSRYFREAIGSSISRAQYRGKSFSVLFIDVDHFKSVNDGNGHLVGSAFLGAIGKLIKATLRNVDLIFRYGGDEFVVILDDASTDGAKLVAERLRQKIANEKFFIRNVELRITVSIGVATYPQHATECDDIISLADNAMYDAKRASRNAVHIATGIESSDPSEKVQSTFSDEKIKRVS